jgi:uncharacterized protein (DUF983 family)
VIPDAPSAELSPIASATKGACPRCGARTLFSGWVKFADRCRACGLDYSGFNVGDGPAAFLIFFVGTVTVVAALLLDAAAEPPWYVHLIWVPFAAGLTILGLRFSKAWLLVQEYRHRAREGRIAK